jgi:hypothetical protein
MLQKGLATLASFAPFSQNSEITKSRKYKNTKRRLARWVFAFSFLRTFVILLATR